MRRSSLLELERCLGHRLTLSDKELHAAAYGSDTETEEQDLEKVRIWPKHFDICLTQLLLSLRLWLFHNNFLLTWSIDCDGNLTNSS